MSSDAPALIVARLHRLLEHTPDAELTIPQYRLLGLLAAGDERSGMLARRLAVSKPTVTALVDGLVERGYAERLADADDRRSVTVSITSAGRVAVDATGAVLRAALDDVVGGCDEPAAVYAAIADLGRALDARWTGPEAGKTARIGP